MHPRTITTTAPLPTTARHWRALLGATPKDDAALARPWTRDGDRPFWFSRGAWALRAIADATGAMVKRSPCLWLPDYFCNEATWPMRQAGVRFVFYPVDETLNPDWPACAALTGDAPPDLFVLVHYFGFESDCGKARAFCDAQGAALIEDAAHMLVPAGGVGRHADFVVYSQHKQLPLPDGALLVVRPAAGAVVAEVEAAWRGLARAAPPSGAWATKRLLQWAVPGVAGRMAGQRDQAFDDDPPSQRMPETSAMSARARRLLAASIASLASAVAARRANEAALRDLFSTGDGLRPLFPRPGDNDVPYRAAFRAIDHDTARAWYDRIVASGNVVETWPDLAPEVRAAPERHAAAIALRETVLALPVNADRTPQALRDAYGAALAAPSSA